MWTKQSIIEYLYSYPDSDDWFGVNIRKTVQSLFPCKHDWVEKDFKRKCKKCWKGQYFVYNRFGKVRYEWRDYPYSYLQRKGDIV